VPEQALESNSTGTNSGSLKPTDRVISGSAPLSTKANKKQI